MPTPVQPPRGPTAPRGPAQPPRGPTPPRTGSAPRMAARPAARKPMPLPKLPGWLERARRMILKPTQEWAAIADEFTTAGPIYARYLLPMAAIGPVASTVGALVFGVRSSLSTLGETYPVSVSDALTSGVLEYGLNLLAIYVLALVIEFLAPAFGSQPNRVQALKVATYGSTPYWLGGALALFPKLARIGTLAGLYSVRLFPLGAPIVMNAPPRGDSEPGHGERRERREIQQHGKPPSVPRAHPLCEQRVLQEIDSVRQRIEVHERPERRAEAAHRVERAREEQHREHHEVHDAGEVLDRA